MGGITILTIYLVVVVPVLLVDYQCFKATPYPHPDLAFWSRRGNYSLAADEVAEGERQWMNWQQGVSGWKRNLPVCSNS